MAKYGMNLMGCLTLMMFFFAIFKGMFAAKYHWNPGKPGYHPYRFQDRKQEYVSGKIDYQGWNYAGRGEFPWLVEIRRNDTENFETQEEWSNGNLVTSKFVLTVCYAVVNIRKYEQGPYAQTDPLLHLGVEQTFLAPKNPKYYKVLFSDDYTYKSVGNGFYTGTRQVKRFIPHPKCNQFGLDFQWGVIEIKRPIWPVPPWTSYMPIDFNEEGFAQVKKKYVETRADLTIASRCTVGLWSRRISAQYSDYESQKVFVYNNDKLWNYKIKYAVINADTDACWKPPSIDAYPSYARVGEPKEEWECMAINSNETLGAVCDHDRGAPIVCDGIVRAIVLLGATGKYCNINKPLPFLVMDIRYAFEMFSGISRVQWSQSKLKHFMGINI